MIIKNFNVDINVNWNNNNLLKFFADSQNLLEGSRGFSYARKKASWCDYFFDLTAMEISKYGAKCTPPNIGKLLISDKLLYRKKKFLPKVLKYNYPTETSYKVSDIKALQNNLFYRVSKVGKAVITPFIHYHKNRYTTVPDLKIKARGISKYGWFNWWHRKRHTLRSEVKIPNDITKILIQSPFLVRIMDHNPYVNSALEDPVNQGMRHNISKIYVYHNDLLRGYPLPVEKIKIQGERAMYSSIRKLKELFLKNLAKLRNKK